MRRTIPNSLQLQEASHGHKSDNSDAETSPANSLSVSKVLKRERILKVESSRVEGRKQKGRM